MTSLRLRDRILTFERRALVMGIVNVTPDSFSDGGRFATIEAAIAHGLELVRQGADILDIGGESTRPGAAVVDLDEESRRVLPVVHALVKQTDVPLSIDTSKAQVARRCLEAGAQIINDVTAFTGDPAMAGVVKSFAAACVLMHMQGTPRTMQIAPAYADVVDDICRYLQERLEEIASQGIDRDKIALDPGIGFGKTQAHNLELLARLDVFQKLGRPICLGVSRKGLLKEITGRSRDQRLAGSLAVACHAVTRGAAQIIRVHDVAETRDAVLTLAALK